MTPEVRTAIIAIGFVFSLFFAALTLGAIIDSGVGPLNVISLAIVVVLLIGLIGALRNPPDG